MASNRMATEPRFSSRSVLRAAHLALIVLLILIGFASLIFSIVFAQTEYQKWEFDYSADVRVTFVTSNGSLSVHWYRYYPERLQQREIWLIDLPPERPGAAFSPHLRLCIEFVNWYEPDVTRGIRSHRYIFFHASGDCLAGIGIALWIYPAIAILLGAVRRTRRRRRRRCLNCGYNLTGNVSGVCPECGLAVKTEA